MKLNHIIEENFHWMVERAHPALGWVCILDNHFTRNNAPNIDPCGDLYFSLWGFIKDEMTLQKEVFLNKMNRFDRTSHSSWCQTYYQKFKDHQGGNISFYTPETVHAVFGHGCPFPFKDLKRPEKIKNFVEKCQVYADLKGMPVVLTADTNLQDSSAHAKMTIMKIFNDLEPITPQTVRIAMNIK